MKTLAGFFLALLPFIPTQFTLAAGLVPCEGTDCNSCHLITLANNVIDWLILVLLTCLTLLFAYAGYRLVTSGGDIASYNVAKRMFQNVIIGLMIVLCSWLVVDTVLKILLVDDAGNLGYTSMGPWNEIPATSCATQVALHDGNLNRWYDSWADLQRITLIREEQARENFANYDGGLGVCNEGFLGSYFPGQASTAQCVLSGESACGAYHESTTDLDRNGVPFSVSPWQINLSVHTIQDCDMILGEGVTLDCPSAYNGTNYSSTIVDVALYNQCSRALTDPVCATVNAQRIYREAGNSWRPWSAYTRNNCG